MSEEQPTTEQRSSEQADIKEDTPASSNNTSQDESEGRDPNVEGSDHPQMKGTGADGSHSAFFGLTPDGHKDGNTKAGNTGPVQPAEGEGSDEASGGGKPTKDDSGSRGVTGDGVARQMHDPKVGDSAKEGEGEQGPID